MIGKLTGVCSNASPDGSALIEVGGVGYVVRMPGATLPLLGEQLSLYIHTAVREDAIDLYGFVSEAELAFFKQLMSVSGIGPKTALGIMSVAPVSSLQRAIAAGDATTLTSTFGVGKKNAERLVVELRDKIKITVDSPDARVGTSSDAELVEALMSLGYSTAESRKAIQSVSSNISGMRDRLAAALRNLGNVPA